MSTAPNLTAKGPRVVIAYMDGRRSQGYVFDFSPMRETCRLFGLQSPPGNRGEVVEIRMLKAIFFLRDDIPAEAGPTAAKPAAPTQRRRIEVIFQDKERLEGTTEGYSKDRLGFFMVPEDPTGKILRVFVVNKNVKEVKWVQASADPATPAPSSAAS